MCLQELKSTVEKVPASLCELQGYRCYWHGERAYSGVGLHIRRDAFADEPHFVHPAFDYETRIVTARLADLVVASVYVPNGGKDFPAKMKFLGEMERYVGETHASGARVIICGDINITRTERDVHPKERNPALVGQRPEEREIFERILAQGLVDLLSRNLDGAGDLRSVNGATVLAAAHAEGGGVGMSRKGAGWRGGSAPGFTCSAA